MSALKKLFHPDRPLFQSEKADGEHHATSHLPHTSISEAPIPPDVRPPQLRHRSIQPYLGFEKQFEDLHEQLRSRPSTKRSKYIDIMSSPSRTKRHVDVLEAIFFRQKQHYSPIILSPTDSYNEEVAERNITNSQQASAGTATRYSQVISAIYQEDVADRNMVSSSPPILVSPPPGEGPTRGYSQKYNKPRRVKESQGIPCSKSFEENAALRAISSDQDLRRLPSCLSNGKSSSGRKPRADSGVNGSLRSRKSAPAFSVQFAGEDEQIPSPRVNDGLGRTKNSADTPHVPSECRGSRKPQSKPTPSFKDTPTATKKVVPESQQAAKSPPSNPSGNLLSPNAARRGSKRNVRDLSINTQLAAPGRKFAKISRQPSIVAVAAPPCKDLNASLDEIVNSPISLTSPVNPSPRITGFSAVEMMNLFKQAYTSSQATSSHPTFESLQDAIIREINSHDAFSHISPQSASPISPVPSLTPGLSSDGRNSQKSSGRPMTAVSRSKSLSSRDGSIASKRNSVRELGGRPDSQGRELSFPAIKGLESKPEDTVARRRRHTYSQSAARVRISDANDIPPLPARSTTGKRPKTSAAAGQLPNVYFANGLNKQSSPNTRQQAPQGFLSKAVSIFMDAPDTLRQSHSEQSLRTLVNHEDISRTSPEISLFDYYDEKLDPNPKGKPVSSTKSSKLHLFIPSRKPARPKHIPIVISDTTTNNIIINSCAGNQKNSNNSPLSSRKRRMPFRIISN
ncbi:uncharacterized protein GIQ15_05008 [Arthroderma uncinatum]|uniref:uncharacterized protein n=1 Tax=Arthroderma uncinatum TaxID=74035 RepID=UPI00144A834E|nr:uncharacterized protein GIQ15_05008 [Arthroderma uncinatum]KAF3482249.1 hypothetical protein GIQ15_05008 [Arthroderma uncinatum]